MAWILLVLLSSYAFSYDYPLSGSVHNISALVEKLAPAALKEVERVISIPNQTVEACGLADFVCDVENIKIDLKLSSEDNVYSLDFFPGNKIHYNLQLPEAEIEMEILAKGRVLGIYSETRFKIFGRGILGVDDGKDDEDVGVLEIYIDNEQIKSRFEKFLIAQVDSIRIESTDMWSSIVYATIDTFMDFQGAIKNKINSNIVDVLNSKKVAGIIEGYINEGLQRLQNIDIPLKQFGVSWNFALKDLFTDEKSLYLRAMTSLLPTNPLAECAAHLTLPESFEGLSSPNDLTNFDGTVITTRIPFDLITKGVFIWFKSMQKEESGEYSNPALCEADQTLIELFGRDVNFEYETKPMGPLTYKIDIENQKYTLNFQLLMSIRSRNFYPRIKGEFKHDGEKYEGILLDVDAIYSLREEEEGKVYLDFNKVVVNDIEGKFKVKILPKLPNLKVSAVKHKDILEEKLNEKFREVFDSILLIDKTLEVEETVRFTHLNHEFTYLGLETKAQIDFIADETNFGQSFGMP